MKNDYRVLIALAMSVGCGLFAESVWHNPYYSTGGSLIGLLAGLLITAPQRTKE